MAREVASGEGLAWHASKAKDNISHTWLYKHHVLLIEDLKLLICPKIEASPMLGFRHRTSTSLCITYYASITRQR